MAPVQQTFSLIPEPPSALNGGDQAGRLSRPPMTTKQAKKAYKAKNKGPKLSKAEQRRQDLMEQDRIRREFEKERNQARAKAARDKRKEKEEKEKEEKKKRGLPIVAVHPSQDTLARFVRKMQQEEPKNEARKLQEHNKVERKRPESLPAPACHLDDVDSDKTLSAEDEPRRSAKRQRVGASPLTVSPVADHVPEDMFRTPRPKSKPAAVLVRTNSCPEVEKATTKDLDTESCRFDPDDPSTEEMVNQQILSESFSVDDGLFDDIDIDAIDVSTIAQKATHIEKDMPPPEPPDQRLQPKEQKIEVKYPPEADGTLKRAETTSNSNFEGMFMSKRDGNQHRNPKNFASRDIFKTQTSTTPSKALTETRSLSLQARPETQSNIGASTTEQARRPLTVAANNKRTPLRELTLNKGNIAKPNSDTNRPADQSIEVQRLSEKPQKPFFCKPPPSFSKPSSFRSLKSPVMGPPSLPPKFKTTAGSTPGNSISTPKFLPQHIPTKTVPTRQTATVATHAESTAHMPFTSTQMLLLSDADDLFPSPSQEVAEIFEEPAYGVRLPLIRPRTAPSAPRFMPPPRCGRPKTATPRNFILSHAQSTRMDAGGHGASHDAPSIKPQAPAGPSIDTMPFFSTQDVLLSSQDLMELKEEKITPAKPLRPIKDVSIHRLAHVSHPTQTYVVPQGRHTYDTPVGKKHTKATLASETSVKQSCDVSTQDRILGPHRQSQQSSSLPETPTNPHSRKTTKTCNKSRLLPSQLGETSKAKENTRLDSLFPEDDIAELLIADLVAEDHGAKQSEIGDTSEALSIQTPVGVQPSPKPFFTSSGTREKVYLAIEKTRTTASRDEQAHRQAQEDLNVLLTREDERHQRMVLEKMLEAEENESQQADLTYQPDRHVSNNGEELSRKKKDEGSRSRRSSSANGKAHRRSQPQSSFEKMLEMLEKSKSDQIAVPASQESDYGEVAWDDGDLVNL